MCTKNKARGCDGKALEKEGSARTTPASAEEAGRGGAVCVHNVTSQWPCGRGNARGCGCVSKCATRLKGTGALGFAQSRWWFELKTIVSVFGRTMAAPPSADRRWRCFRHTERLQATVT